MGKYNLFYNYDELMYQIGYHEILGISVLISEATVMCKIKEGYFESVDHFVK